MWNVWFYAEGKNSFGDEIRCDGECTRYVLTASEEIIGRSQTTVKCSGTQSDETPASLQSKPTLYDPDAIHIFLVLNAGTLEI